MPPIRAWPLALLACLGSGLLIAAALPPIGIWPLAFAGIFLLDWVLADQSVGARFVRGFVAEAAVLLPTLTWMSAFTPAGYVAASLIMAAMFGLVAMAVPSRQPARWLALPAAVVLFEAIRGRWPFGGVPLSTLAYAQVAGPLAPVARVGGALLLIGVTVVAGVALAAFARRAWRAAAIAAAVVVVAVGVAIVAPRGTPVERIDVALVQGGGPQGTISSETEERHVYERHLEASADVPEGTELVVWPEDVVDLDGPLAGSPEADTLAALARRLDATLVVGVIEDEGDRFRNAAVAFGPDGEIVDRYEKVRRVPFGEYVPLRRLLAPFGPTDLVPRDAIVGTGPAVLDTAVGRLGVVVSWEVWFGDRARDAIGHGGRVLLNPTNGSSFSGTVVQTQQIAASRLRAIETGRWALQVAPTGFTAMIDDTGTVLQRSGISEQTVLSGPVELREGQTIATRVGDWLAVGLAVAALAAAWVVDRRRRRSDLEQHGDRPAVDQLHVHVGTEAAAGDGGAQLAQAGGDHLDERLGHLRSGGRDP
jgi:apolipoprotein N-acyltransferase